MASCVASAGEMSQGSDEVVLSDSEPTKMTASTDSLSDGYISDSASSLGPDAEEKDVSTDADVIEFAKCGILTPPVCCLSLSLSLSLSSLTVAATCTVGTLAWIRWPTAICSG